MKRMCNVIICVTMVILCFCTVFSVPKNAYVLAEVTEVSTQESGTETTQESQNETTEQSTGTSTTEETTEEETDEISPEIELICLDEDKKAQDEIRCQITVTEEHLVQTTIYVEWTTIQGKTVSSTIENLAIENGVSKEFGFSEEGYYQIYAQSKDETGNETTSEMLTFLIDRTVPVIAIDMGEMKEGGSYATQKKKYVIGIEIQDEYLMKDSCEITLIKDSEEKEMVYQWIEEPLRKRTTVMLDNSFLDGNYKICVGAKDQVGNINQKTISFTVDNTSPEIKMDSITDVGKWTKEDIVFQTEVGDTLSGLQEITYKVKGKVVKKVTFQEKVYQYSQEVVVSEEADKATGYAVVIEVKNGAGIKKTMKQQVYIDRTKPELILAGVEDGAHYNRAQTITTQVKDISYKGTKTIYHVTRTMDGKQKKMIWDSFSSDQYEDSCVREALEEGYYEIYAVSTDSVGLQTRSDTVSFVIDYTAPVVELKGVESKEMKAKPVVLQLSCVESFYSTNDVKVDIQRTLDGKTTTEQVTGFSTEKNAEIEKLFGMDGTYLVTISAKDKAGNVAATQSITFSIDQTKPELQITGTSNYKLCDGPATLQFKVVESFYESNQVAITGTRKNIDGKMENLGLPQIVNTGKSSSVMQSFHEDGIYDLQIFARDKAGNENVQRIHFVIDQTNPEINGVEQYDGGYFQTFDLEDVMKDIFRDLTVVSYHMRLNGVEYNGIDKITQEGKYVLQIHVQDELQHETMQSVEFVVDNTPPKVHFFGVSDGETVYTSGEVTFCLVDQDDTITGVRMNGKSYDTDVEMLCYEECGRYQIEVDGQDRAGNRSTQSITFFYADTQKDGKSDYVVVGVAFVLICVGLLLGIGIRLKRRGN